MHGHYGIDRNTKTPTKKLNKLLLKAIEKELTDRAWEIWKSIFPLMASGLLKFVGFNEYKDKIFSQKNEYTEISNDAIESEMSAMIRR